MFVKESCDTISVTWEFTTMELSVGLGVQVAKRQEWRNHKHSCLCVIHRNKSFCSRPNLLN